jgi:Xaa-Pro aminopeptidase
MRQATIQQHAELQQVAKAVLKELVDTIEPHSTERSIADTAVRMLAARGVTDTWYYRCPALVLLGDRSCLSISGADYVSSVAPAGEFNLVTVDLSPARGNIWADCARSMFVEDGTASAIPRHPDFAGGHHFLQELHAEMRRFATPETSFHQLWEFGNTRISAGGYVNLDFLGNLGHSIATERSGRWFIEAGNERRLQEAQCFTFEPHVRRTNQPWGFKHEDIYYFDDGGELHAL